MEKITKIAALIVIVIALMFMLIGHLNKVRAMMADMPKSYAEISTAESAASTPESAESNSDDKSDGFMEGFIYSQLINYALK